MSGTVKEAIGLLEILAETDQNFALAFIKKLVLAWDPDYTKLTLMEHRELVDAEKDIEEKGTIYIAAELLEMTSGSEVKMQEW